MTEETDYSMNVTYLLYLLESTVILTIDDITRPLARVQLSKPKYCHPLATLVSD